MDFNNAFPFSASGELDANAGSLATRQRSRRKSEPRNFDCFIVLPSPDSIIPELQSARRMPFITCFCMKIAYVYNSADGSVKIQRKSKESSRMKSTINIILASILLFSILAISEGQSADQKSTMTGAVVIKEWKGDLDGMK